MIELGAKILVVDDQPDNLLILEDVLGEYYEVSARRSGEEALEYFEQGGMAELVLLDVLMRGMDGFEVCQRLKSSSHTRDIPVIFLTGLDAPADEEFGLSLGAEDFIHKPFSLPVVLARVRNHLRLSRATRMLRSRNEDLEQLVMERTREIRLQSEALVQREQEVVAVQSATIIALCALAEARDNETGNHIRRTQHYVRALAEQLKHYPRFSSQLDEETIQLLFRSAALHDVGKVAIPDAILLKPGKLNREEWEVMKRHTIYGRDAIACAQRELGDTRGAFLRYAKEIACSHHERWDGGGYPEGLVGEAIPFSARLMAVADVYDALISRRVYKEAFSHQQAIATIAAERGVHFDPDVVDALLEISDDFWEIANQFSDELHEAAS